MQEYFKALYQFCLELRRLENIDYEEKNLIFLGASAIFGFLTAFLDIVAYKIMGKSVLGIHYSNRSKYFWVIIGWTFATTIVSYFGLIMSIFSSTIQSCVIVGLSWLYIIIQLAKRLSNPDDKQQ